jgi:hypothetical protein
VMQSPNRFAFSDMATLRAYQAHVDAAGRPGQAQPQQPQPQGTPYNPQQGQPFGAWSPQPAQSANARQPSGWSPPSGSMLDQALRDRASLGATNQPGAAFPLPQQQPGNQWPPRGSVPPSQQGPSFSHPVAQRTGPSPQPQGGGQSQGPSFSHPVAQYLPAFQFRATDFMGNQFNNPGAFTAQQGATAHALNQQRTQQILNMFTNGTPLGGLNPMAAYHQGQQMLRG